jgi:hypothetical protein
LKNCSCHLTYLHHQMATKNFWSPKGVGACAIILEFFFSSLTFFFRGSKNFGCDPMMWVCRMATKIFGHHPTHPHSLMATKIFWSSQKGGDQIFSITHPCGNWKFQSPLITTRGWLKYFDHQEVFKNMWHVPFFSDWKTSVAIQEIVTIGWQPYFF